ncbi:MAG: hypothetical protein Kow0027_26880 [Saprospiraceae bacterium]
MPDRKKVLVDTSCLIVLKKLDRLSLLNELYDEVIVTPQVLKEYGLELPEWVKVKDTSNRTARDLLLTQLGNGEASIIAVALEHRKHILILDDAKARKIATRLELQLTGTLGVLAKAKLNGMIDNLSTILEDLEALNFHISDHLKRQILKAVGELD